MDWTGQLSYFTLPYTEKRAALLVTMQRIAITENRAVQEATWMHPSVKEEDIAKSRGAFLLLKKILSDLDTQPPGLTGKVLTAWKGQREKEMIYLAQVLRTVKSRDVRLSSLQKVRRAIEKEKKELTELQVSSMSAAEKDIKAQEIIGQITSTIGYLEFVMTHPKLVTGLGAAVWNKTAVKVSKKLFNKTLSRLDAIESGKIAKRLAPLMVKMPGADHIALEFLKSRISWRPDLQDRRAAELGFDLFGDIPKDGEILKDIDLRVARAWMADGVEKATAFLAKYLGPAMVFMDFVTVTLDTIDEVDRWASTLFKSGVTAWAIAGTGIFFDQIVATSGTIAATGAELGLMEAAIAEALLAFNTSAAVAAATSEVLPLAAFALATGAAIAIGIVVAASLEFLVEVFFGPEHIPSGLRARFSAPISAPQLRTLSAPIAAA